MAVVDHLIRGFKDLFQDIQYIVSPQYNLYLKPAQPCRHRVEEKMRILDTEGVIARQQRRFKRGVYRSAVSRLK